MFRPEIAKQNMAAITRAYEQSMFISVRPNYAWSLADLHCDYNLTKPGYLEPDYGRLRC